MPEQDGRKWNRLYFDEWVEREGLDLIRGHKVDVYEVPLKLWARTGGQAVQIQLDGTGELNSAYVCEIAPGKRLEPQRHLYEELVFVLAGRGSTTVWYAEQRKRSFEWQAGSLFAIPLNANYQHFNVSGTDSIRYVAVTTAPVVMNLFRDDDFIFENETVFRGRYAEEPDYFGFYSPELEGFTGIGHSVEDCLYQARWGMKEHVELLAEQGLPIPPRNSDPIVTIRNEQKEAAA